MGGHQWPLVAIAHLASSRRHAPRRLVMDQAHPQSPSRHRCQCQARHTHAPSPIAQTLHVQKQPRPSPQADAAAKVDVAKLVKLTTHSKPQATTHWSTRTMAQKLDVSAARVSLYKHENESRRALERGLEDVMTLRCQIVSLREKVAANQHRVVDKIITV